MAFPTGYTKYQEITIDHTKVDADLTDYVVYVDLANLVKAGADIFDTCRSDGGDIRATKSDGTTQLATELVAIDTTGKTGELHIKFTGTLSGSSSTIIRIWYNGSDTALTSSDTYGRNNVWSNYTGVWHLQNTDGATGSYDLTNNGASSAAAKMGSGYDFGGTSQDDYLQPATNAPALSGNWAVTALVKMDTLGDYSGIFSKLSTTRDGAGGNQNFILVVHDDGKIGSNPGGSWHFSTAAGITTATWYKVTWSYNNSTNVISYFVNGTAYGTTTSWSPNESTTFKFFIGSWNSTVSDYRHDGLMDEVRIIQNELASTWISTEYNNQNSPSTFYSVGDEVGGGGSSFNAYPLLQQMQMAAGGI